MIIKGERTMKTTTIIRKSSQCRCSQASRWQRSSRSFDAQFYNDNLIETNHVYNIDEG